MSFLQLNPHHSFHGNSIHKPISPLWIVFTFVLSYVLNLITDSFNEVWLPDFLALTLVYWTIRYPRHVGMLIAFICGILMDAHNGSVLGQQALGYVVLSYLAYSFHRRIPWFNGLGQTLHIVPFLFISQVIVLLVRLWLDGLWPDPIWFLQSITGGILWVFWGAILSWPEHRSKSDNNA